MEIVANARPRRRWGGGGSQRERCRRDRRCDHGVYASVGGFDATAPATLTVGFVGVVVAFLTLTGAAGFVDALGGVNGAVGTVVGVFTAGGATTGGGDTTAGGVTAGGVGALPHFPSVVTMPLNDVSPLVEVTSVLPAKLPGIVAGATSSAAWPSTVPLTR